MNLVKKYINKYKSIYTKSIAFAIIGVIAGLFAYWFLANLIIELFSGNRDMGIYLKYCAYLGVCFLVKEVLASASTAISHKATFLSLKDIRKDISSKLYKMPLGDIINIPSGKLKNIIVDQVDSMETTLAHIIPEMTANLVGPILLLIYVFVVDWRLALISLIPMIIGMFFMKAVMKTYTEKYAKSVEITQGMNNAVVEYINGIEVIKTFNQSETSYKKYSDAVYNNAEFYYNWMKSCQWGVSIYRTISPMSLLTVLPLGVLFYINGSITVTNFIAIIVLSFGIVENILTASNYIDDLSRIGTITGSIESILNSKELEHKNDKRTFENYNIEFKNVNFSYEEEKNIINNMNLFINEKEITAFVGPSGGGKSTITKLIAGFWDLDEGEILIGNENIKNIPLKQLSEIISYVSQDNYLFDLSVRENIRIGNPNATDEEVEEMAKASGCDNFIKQLENGYDTIVGEGGGHLSGGERQRVSIARAMLKDSPIVILDEATAYMDSENESVIQQAISKLVKGKTLILVAHRLRTISNVDKIFVVKDGEIEAFGTHSYLLDNSNIYKDMWSAAMKEDNDDNSI